MVDDADAADVVLLLLDPQSGDYFNATPGLLELTLCQDKPLRSIACEPYTETTLSDLRRFRDLADAARERGATVVLSVNVSLGPSAGGRGQFVRERRRDR